MNCETIFGTALCAFPTVERQEAVAMWLGLIGLALLGRAWLWVYDRTIGPKDE